jgi:hypothetical protein
VCVREMAAAAQMERWSVAQGASRKGPAAASQTAARSAKHAMVSWTLHALYSQSTLMLDATYSQVHRCWMHHDHQPMYLAYHKLIISKVH